MGRVDFAGVVFGLLVVLTLGGAAVVAFSRDLARSSAGLTGTLLGVAGLYATLSAGFLAAVQVLVYVGTSFVLLLVSRARTGPSPASSRRGAGFVAFAFAVALVSIAAGTRWPTEEHDSPVASASRIGHALLGPYALSLELVTLLLVVALVGALVVVARRDPDGTTP